MADQSNEVSSSSNSSHLLSLLSSGSQLNNNRKRRSHPNSDEDIENKGPSNAIGARRTQTTTPIPRPTMEWFQFQNKHPKTPTIDPLEKWIWFYHTTVDSSHQVNRNIYNVLQTNQKLGRDFIDQLNAQFDTINSKDCKMELARDSKEQHAYGIQFIKRVCLFSSLPLQAQVSLVRQIHGSNYVNVLLRRSMDLNEAIRFANNKVLHLNSICFKEHPVLKKLMSYIIVNLLEPFRAINLDAFEMFSLLSLHLWITATDKRLLHDETLTEALEIKNKLISALETHIRETRELGRIGKVFMLLGKLSKLDDLMDDVTFTEYRQKGIFLIPDELIESLILLS